MIRQSAFPAHGPSPSDGLLATLRAHAARPGEALVTDARRLSRQELAAVVAAAAEALARQGIGPGSMTGVTLRDETEHLLASWRSSPSGRRRRPSPPSRHPGRAPPLPTAWASRPCSPTGRRTRCPGGAFSPGGRSWRSCPPAPRPPDPDAPALVMSGSGTSGRPKIVACSYRDLAARAAICHPGCESGRAFAFATVEHDTAKRQRIYGALLGGTVVLSALRGEALRRFLAEARAGWVEASLVHCADLVALGRRGLPLPPGVSVRAGGLRLPHALRQDMLRLVTPGFWVSYGATEAGRITMAAPGDHDEEETVGPPIPGVEVSILRPDGSEGYAEGFAGLVSRILADLPRARLGGIRCLGMSMGGAAALYAGLLPEAEQAVALAGGHPARRVARLNLPGLDGWEMDRALDEAGRGGGATRLLAVHAEGHAADAAGALALRAALPALRILALPGTAEHNLATEMRSAGRLEGFLDRVAFGDVADGGPW